MNTIIGEYIYRWRIYIRCPGGPLRTRIGVLCDRAVRKEDAMTEKLVFYTHPRSRGRIVRWMLEETGAKYRTEAIEYATEIKSPRYLAINPMGKVPAIRHRGTVVTETAAICAYLADAFPEAGLAPAPQERGAYYRWLFFGAGPLEQAIINRSLGFEVPKDREPMVGYGTYATVVDVLEAELAKTDFVAGARFTAADVYLGSHIGWGLAFGTIEKRGSLVDYWARVAAREARQRASKLDDALAAASG